MRIRAYGHRNRTPNGTLCKYARALARQHILYATEPGNEWCADHSTIILVITWSKTQFLKRNMRARPYGHRNRTPNGTLRAYARALARQHILYATEPGNLWRVNQGTIVLVITWSKTQFLKRNMRAGAWTPWQKK